MANPPPRTANSALKNATPVSAWTTSVSVTSTGNWGGLSSATRPAIPTAPNNYLYCHNNPINFIDPLGLRRDKTGYIVKGTGQHIVPVSTWDEFNFVDEAKGIFDKATVGENFKDHNMLGHGPSKGYTGHVRELMADTIADYTEKVGKQGKLSIDQQKDLANLIVEKVKNTDNGYIKGFNNSIKKGGKPGLIKWLAKNKKLYPQPNAKTLKRIKQGYGVIKGIAKIPAGAIRITKKIPGAKYLAVAAIATLVYNNARADGMSRNDALRLSALESVNPFPIGPDDLRQAKNYIKEKYDGEIDEGLATGRGENPNPKGEITKNINSRRRFERELMDSI